MKRFGVTIPIAGEITVEIEAENAEAAIEAALEGRLDIADIADWAAYRRLHKGNVCYVETAWEARAEEILD